MATMEVLRAVESAAFERDQQEFALGDTLDIKTGLILAALTFLAIQTGDLMKSTGVSHVEVWATILGNRPISWAFFQWMLQFVSVLAMIAGGALAIRVLIPREYDREPPPSEYMDWVTKTETYRKDYPETGTEPVTVETLTAKRIANATKNVSKNLALNKRKSDLMFNAFTCTAIAFIVNILTLATHLF